jgi:hypothetical protein
MPGFLLLVCFSDRFSKFARAGLRPKSSYFHLAGSWDYRCPPPHSAETLFFRENYYQTKNGGFEGLFIIFYLFSLFY